MRRLGALLLLSWAGCSNTSLRIDVSLATDVPPLHSIFVRMFGTREIGAGKSVPLSSSARSGQILITDINPSLTDFRVLLTGVSTAAADAAQGVVRVRPKPGDELRASAVLAAGLLPDGDGDGVPDAIDNCPLTADPRQDATCATPDLAGADLAGADLSAVDASRDLTPGPDLAGPVFAISGSVSGLGGTLVLRNNGSDTITLTTDGPFSFNQKLNSGVAYAVTVQTQPSGQLCTVANGSGTVANADVINIAVTCVPGHTVGGMLSGLGGGTLILNNNGADPLPLTTNGAFTFTTPVAENSGYAVAIASPAPAHTCVLSKASGTVGTTNVTDLMVDCTKQAVVINEVYARPATGALGDTNGDGVRDGTQDEFVEILNNDALAADLSGFVIKSGTTSSTTRFTFPPSTTLAPGARAVVFGGGTPTGEFGGAVTFSIGGGNGLSLTDAPTSGTVSLEVGSFAVDTFTYGAATFGSSCTTNCASQVRNPEGSGAFVAHGTAAGNAGILWSPGVDAVAAIPKAELAFSVPAPAATNVSVVAFLEPRFNMFMNATDFDAAHLKLFASTCAAMANPVSSFSSIGAGGDLASARLIPSSPLAFATTYCVAVTTGIRSAINVPLPTAASWEFTSRPAASAPATNVVISEVGGCRVSSTSGATACGGTGANDEFVELYNPTMNSIDISGWFVQRRTAGGSTTCGATLPAATTLAAGHYYLVGGAGYTASRYAGAPAADLTAAGSLMVGGSETLALITNAGSCTGSSNIVDAVSYGTITESLAALQLPPATGFTDGSSIERKGCFNSTADANATTGLFTGGGQELLGNRERIGAGNADWVVRPSPNPQNAAAAAETANCPP